MEGFCGSLTTVSTWVLKLSTLRKGHAYICGMVSLVGPGALNSQKRACLHMRHGKPCSLAGSPCGGKWPIEMGTGIRYAGLFRLKPVMQRSDADSNLILIESWII